MRSWLSPAGALSAALVGAAVWFGLGWRGFVLLALFLVTSSLLTRGGGRRTPAQVLANGGLAAVCAALARWHPALTPSFAGAIAAAAADTWSTEIGGRSSTPPRLLTTLRPVAAGVSGGVTVLGSVGGLAGAAMIGAASVLLGLVGAKAGVWVAAAGLFGTVADSLLGATLQARWRCSGCGLVIETRRHGCGGAGTPLSGIAWLNNDGVNFIATLAGAAVAGLLTLLVRAPPP